MINTDFYKNYVRYISEEIGRHPGEDLWKDLQ